MSKPKELYPESAEKRMDIIGPNGNDGLHYKELEARGHYPRHEPRHCSATTFTDEELAEIFADDHRNGDPVGCPDSAPAPRDEGKTKPNWRFIGLVGAFFYAAGLVGLIAIEGIAAGGLQAGAIALQAAGTIVFGWSSFMMGRCWGHRADGKREPQP